MVALIKSSITKKALCNQIDIKSIYLPISLFNGESIVRVKLKKLIIIKCGDLKHPLLRYSHVRAGCLWIIYMAVCPVVVMRLYKGHF